MDPVFRWIESSALSVWTRESTSLLAFPAILSAHAIGMALAAGVNAAIALHLLGDEARTLPASADRFAISQDQRHTVRGRIAWQVTSRAWVALAGAYGSGLPVEFSRDRDAAIAQYGQRIVDRADLESGRVRPAGSFDASASVILVKTRNQTVRVQADILNVADRLNVINFAGLFSGTAVATPRSSR